ncbi:hypothetical protein [Halococcus salifodinae]|uniref:Uncharacterized protein n=1 Tax=Halococcus salifodinae DSM 8989 TaxID=1227456 RepID=M0NBA1_9EURY|nr:hypothetical protein [Halococcus salifodinae]EMA54374.1 hypothetical protein C450_06075 [Halococcus salifodinae DSM 8989]
MSETQSATASEAETENRTEPEAAGDTNSIPREQQMVFGDDGEIEPDGDTVETSLEAFGAEVDHSEGSGRVAKPSATQFGVDDRTQVPQRGKTKTEESDQRSLFADVETDQQTLGGKSAANRCLFGNSSESCDASNRGEQS